MSPQRIDWIQALRGIAALLVVLAHGRNLMVDSTQWLLAERLLYPGAMGVDLFFIISGFIMVHSTRYSDGSLAYTLQFAIKRFTRIWPTYTVITLVWVALTGWDTQLLPNMHWLVKSILFIPANPTQALYFGVTLPVGWTLDFEMYFYLIFGIALLFKQLRWAVLLVWIASTVFIFPIYTHTFTFDVLASKSYAMGYLHLMANPIILEFAAGVLIGLMYYAQPITITSKKIAYHVLALSISLPLWLIYGWILQIHGPTQWGWPLALMVLGIAITSKTLNLQTPRLLSWLGEISFSLYLTHMLTIYAFNMVMVASGWKMHMPSWSYLFITTIASITVASLSHHYLEKKLSNALQKRLLGLAPKRSAASATGVGS